MGPLTSERQAGARPAVPVLMFHGLCERMPAHAVFAGGRTCLLPAEDFAAVVAWCCREYDVIRLSELNECLAGRLRAARPLVVTFDDGLASVIDLAVPILRQYRAPATVFVATEWTNSARTPAIFEVERILSARMPSTLAVDKAGARFSAVVKDRQGAGIAVAGLWEFLFRLRVAPLSLGLADIAIDGRPASAIGLPEDRHFWFPASWSELRAAARDGVIEIGSHTRTHMPLTWLASDAAREELAGSQARLEAEFGQPVTACAYPHGITDARIAALAAESYAWVFSSAPGMVRRDTSRSGAPRLHVPSENWRSIKRGISIARWDIYGLRPQLRQSLGVVRALAVGLCDRGARG